MATVSWGAEYTVTSSAPGIKGKATYSIDAYGNATITMTMRANSNGAWANDPWCAWVNGVSKDTSEPIVDLHPESNIVTMRTNNENFFKKSSSSNY